MNWSQGLSDWVVAGISPGIMSIKIFNFIIISLLTKLLSHIYISTGEPGQSFERLCPGDVLLVVLSLAGTDHQGGIVLFPGPTTDR